MQYEPIAHIENDFPTKFGLPRQSGLSEHLVSRIIMEPRYRDAEAFRGIEEFEYLWLIWVFAEMGKRAWSPTVRPPKLGGNKRVGVFATRSPNRPNPIGLTRVRLLGVAQTPQHGTVLTVGGADLMSGTAILDIKPYLPFADSVPGAAAGGYEQRAREKAAVEIPPEVAALFTEEQLQTLREVLACDPRPGYQHDAERVYGFAYAGYDVRFTAKDGVIAVLEAVREPRQRAANISKSE